MRKSKGQRPGKSNTMVIRIYADDFKYMRRAFPKHSAATAFNVLLDSWFPLRKAVVHEDQKSRL